MFCKSLSKYQSFHRRPHPPPRSHQENGGHAAMSHASKYSSVPHAEVLQKNFQSVLTGKRMSRKGRNDVRRSITVRYMKCSQGVLTKSINESTRTSLELDRPSDAKLYKPNTFGECDNSIFRPKLSPMS